jgi:GT2 family glycosyltransferase
VLSVLKDKRVVAGGFLKRYRDAGVTLRLMAKGLNLVRSRWLGHLVGTQAIFVRRSVFERLGGFRELPLLEDVDLCDRLRRAGRVVVIEPAVTVSSRRYHKRGVLRQIGINGLVLLLYRLGAGPARLLRMYRGREQ